MNGDNDEGQNEGPRFLSPEEMQEEWRRHHDRAHMRHDAWLRSIQLLFDAMDAEQLMTLRTIVTNTSAATFYDGQIYQILRLKHHIDPDTGEPLVTEEALLSKDRE